MIIMLTKNSKVIQVHTKIDKAVQKHVMILHKYTCTVMYKNSTGIAHFF